MPRWNENLWPPNGYEFPDAEKILHKGTSLTDLISKLATYRARRGLPPGNPVAEVNDYLCRLYPSRCLKGVAESKQPVEATGTSLPSRVAEWLRGTWLRIAGKGVEFVPEEEVKRRAVICLACPFHAGFPQECAACSETVNRISFQLRAGRDKHTSHLKVCAQFGSDLRVDVLTVQEPQPKAPSNCWKRGAA